MRKFSGRAALSAVLPCLAACSSVVPPARTAGTVVLYYQHVANAHQVRFSSPLPLWPRPTALEFVTPLNAEGFWAIFVLCSVDARGSVLPDFAYDPSRFRVSYGAQAFGPLQPYTLRYEGGAELNMRGATPVIARAIDAEIEEGPPAQVFGRGYHPSLNYRFAVYVPRALPGYAGEQLALSYAGQPAIARGNGHPPSDLPAVGGNGAGIAARCLP